MLPEVYVLPSRRLQSATAMPATQYPPVAIAQVFRSFDTDRSGALCASELHDAFHELGLRVTKAASDEVFKCIDTNHDSQLSLEEFSAAVDKANEEAAANPLCAQARLLLGAQMGVRRLERSLSTTQSMPPPIG